MAKGFTRSQLEKFTDQEVELIAKSLMHPSSFIGHHDFKFTVNNNGGMLTCTTRLRVLISTIHPSRIYVAIQFGGVFNEVHADTLCNMIDEMFPQFAMKRGDCNA